MVKQGLMISAACLLSMQVLAGTPASPMYAKNGAKIVALSVGPAWYLPSTTQTIALEPDVIKRYVDDGNTRILTNGELFFAIQCLLGNQLFSQVGLAVAYSGNAQLRGDVYEDNNPNFNNFNYRYQINHARVGIKGKLLAELGYPVQPYLSAGAAIAFNHAFDYQITSKIFEEIPAPIFISNTTTAFAYTVGAGVQTCLNAHWQVGVGYEFADLGKSQLAAASGQTINQGIRITHLNTHELQFTLSYLI